ncbi:MAG: substrate-binding domain-containing protein [Rhizobiaceae bacterium]|nr:substrate-binding domain-containing protein [Rhizobiaceae bacterium]
MSVSVFRKLVISSVSALLMSGAAHAFEQGDLIRPIDRDLNFIFVPKLIHPWYEEVRKGIEVAVAEQEKAGIKVNVVWDAPPQADVADHNNRIEANIGKKPDGLGISCLDPGTNTRLVGEAVSAGLNVVTFDTFCDEQFNFIGDVNTEQVGYDVGKALAEKLGGKGDIAVLSGSLTAPNHVERLVGFKKALQEYPDMKIVFERPDNDNLETAVSLTENALQAHPNLAAVFGNNASNPVGAARAVKNAGLSGKVLVVGTNALPETIPFIEDGTIYACASDRQWEMGYWAVKYLVALNQGHTIPHLHVTGTKLLTKESLGK